MAAPGSVANPRAAAGRQGELGPAASGLLQLDPGAFVIVWRSANAPLK